VKAASQTLVHLGVLAASVVTALAVWTREKDPKALATGDVVVWSGHSADVEKATYESKSRKVLVQSRKDGAGRYFTGTAEKDPPAPHHAADAGAPPPPGPRTTVGFVSVGPGDKLAESLAPLKALRSLGKIGDDRAAEFGLADPDATVTVTIGGVEHKLLVGATAPGGGDRYVRDGASSEVYVVKGDAIRNLESAESLLLERDLHEWKDAEITRARIEAGGKAREVVRSGPEGKPFWADPQSADTKDETVGNWMSKLEKLRPSEFVLTDPEGRETVLKIDYTGRKPLGFVELVRVKSGDKLVFYLRTEHTRLYGKVTGTQADQLEQDLGTIVK
jgi:Domain of unknown function (DUF4340)